ncbi:hypothetical protein [Halosolutus gelatinilyticus]|uniref:hypothetical protein n=1 Tax=Halosolutus gelatinilyticus TaxID=2931975 RepID=UPI001FF4A62C|nr:hypothetical protein [Halosolutus gelatinilyticus]
MCATFSSGDVEKRVENANGEEIGVITAIEGKADVARVEPRSDVMDSTRAALGWSGTHEDTITIHADAVDEISSQAVRLRAESMIETDASTDASPDSTADVESDDPDPRNKREAEGPTVVESTSETADAEPSPADPAGTSDLDERDADRSGDSDADESDGADPDEADEFEPFDAAEATTAAEEPEPIGEPAIDSAGSGPGGGERDSTAVPDATDDVKVSEASETSEPEELNLADELNIGIDADSLEDVGGSDDDRESDRAAASGDRDLTDDVSRGVDVEAAVDDPGAEAGDDANDIESMDLADALDRGADLESVAEAEADESDASKTMELAAERGGNEEPAAKIDPGVDAVSAAEPDSESKLEIDPETLAGPGADLESGTETAARRSGPDESTSTADGEGRSESDRGRSSSRSSERGGRSSPVDAAFAAQRTAMRAAIEGPLQVQRRTLELTSATTRNYFETVAAMTTPADDTREERQSLEAAESEPNGERRSRTLEERREHIRELQDRVNERLDRGDDRIADLFERQIDLLERYQQQLDRD